jgi:hypothetical protein
LVASVPYGSTGVVAVDSELELADARLARGWAPSRNLRQ